MNVLLDVKICTAPLTRALKGFFLRFGGRQSVTMVFTRWPREDSFPVSRALGGTCRRLSRFCNILLQDLTLLVKISRSTNFLSVCRRKLKLLTHLHTVSYNHIRFLNTRSRLVRILASSEYYSITSWIMSEETFFPCKCDIFCFFEFLLLGNSSTAPVFSSIK